MCLTYQLVATGSVAHKVIDEISNYLLKSAKTYEMNKPSLIKFKYAEFTVHLYSEQ